MMERRTRRVLTRVIFAVAVFTALALAILSRPPKRLIDFDQSFYLTVAYDLARHHVFSNGVFDDIDSTVAVPPAGMFFAPLYPWLLVGVMKVDPRFAATVACTIEANEKKRDLSSCEIYAFPMLLVHALLLTLAVLAIAAAGEIIVSRRIFYPAAIMATLGVAAEAELFSFLMTESLWLSLYSMLMWAFVVGLKTWRRRAFLLAGLVLGMLCLARVSFLVLAPILLGLIPARWFARAPRSGSLAHAGALAMALAIVLAPWVVRNYVSIGRLALTEEYGSATLIERFAFNDMRPSEFFLAFPYCVPTIGPAIVNRLFGEAAMYRFEWDRAGGFFDIGRRNRMALVAAHHRLDPIMPEVFREEMQRNWWRHLVTTIPLAWCGLWISGLWSVIAIPVFVCACVVALRERNRLFFLYALPGLILVGVHAALANHDWRYNLGLIGPFSIGAAWMLFIALRATRPRSRACARAT